MAHTSKRILQITSYGPRHLGGLEACAEMMAKHLSNEKWSVEWVFSEKGVSASPGEHYLSFHDPLEKRIGIPMPIPSLRSIRRLWQLVRAADFLLIHDVFYLNSVISALVAAFSRKPVVLLIHVWRVPCRKRFLRVAQVVARKIFGAICLRVADAIVCYNKLILAEVSERTQAAKCQFIPNGVHDCFEVQELLLPVPRVRRRVIFAGRFVEKKGLHLVREAAEALPDVDFLICGSGPINPNSWHLANVASRLAGRAELALIFQEADLLLLPSRGEGFPLIIQEAMRCGLPCAIFHETWAAWGRDPELFLLLEEGNWLQALRQFLASPRSQHASRLIQEYAVREWNWERTAESYRELFLQLRPEMTGARSHRRREAAATFAAADTRRAKPSFVR